jgi:hypothetical protein
MAAPEARESRAAISLLAVLVAAKAAMLAGRQVPVSAWMPFVYLWQDVLVALVFGVAGRLLRRPVVTWTCYGLLAAYAALNVPVALELASPLSTNMLRAARGPLADSIAHALTWHNVGAIGVVLVVASIAPWLTRRLPERAGARVALPALVWIFIGALATPHMDTHGWHRNAIGGLVPAAVPVAASAPTPADWRASPFPSPAGPPDLDLRALGGTARGNNVLLISLESTAAQYLGIYGAPRDPMPRLTSFSRRALVFDRVYAAYPESIKGLFGTLCSRFPAYGTATEIYSEAPCRSLPGVLKDEGYRTALFHSGRFDYLDMRSVIDGRGFDVLEDAGAIGGDVQSSFGVDERSSVDRILGWMDALGASDRFFVTYLPIQGHHPYATTAPGPFEGRTEFDRYLNALHEGDAALGRLLDGLRVRGRDRDTLLVIAGDHGEAFGQHAGNSGHTQFIYDENIHVPFVVALPGWSGTGGDGRTLGHIDRIDRVGSLIDTAPTILDLLGLPQPSLQHGVSLLDPAPRMALFFTDYSLGWLGLADGCWTYRFQVESARSSLYDACADPGETTDRSRELGDRVQAYRTRLEGWATSEREALRRRR